MTSSNTRVVIRDGLTLLQYMQLHATPMFKGGAAHAKSLVVFQILCQMYYTCKFLHFSLRYNFKATRL